MEQSAAAEVVERKGKTCDTDALNGAHPGTHFSEQIAVFGNQLGFPFASSSVSALTKLFVIVLVGLVPSCLKGKQTATFSCVIRCVSRLSGVSPPPYLLYTREYSVTVLEISLLRFLSYLDVRYGSCS